MVQTLPLYPNVVMDDTPSRPTKVSIRVFLFAEHQMVLETLHRFIDSNRDMKVMSAVGPTGLQ
jgi:hypothetical protein